ncbi:hypothetical protein MWH28_08460 [Natroniella sulfidigena]|nr:hypothetical protein [Natroniella sulfidigena]MCK8817388.1 hypothetical protein [Natroniella sulfidigena]
MDLSKKFKDKWANLSENEVDKLRNMEEAMNEDKAEKNIRLMVVTDK